MIVSRDELYTILKRGNLKICEHSIFLIIEEIIFLNKKKIFECHIKHIFVQ